MKEIWKDVVGYEALYQVSNLGNVRSVDRKVTYKSGRTIFHKGKQLYYYTVRGYKYVALSKHNAVKRYRVHRLVATAFIPNPNNLPEVNHINEDKSDNRVVNLEWCDRMYNAHYGNAIKKRCGRKTSEQTRQKISQSLVGHIVRVDTRQKISKALLNYNLNKKGALDEQHEDKDG